MDELEGSNTIRKVLKQKRNTTICKELQQKMKSLSAERDRAVERFVIREEYLIVLLIVCSIHVLLFCAGLKVQENNTCVRQMQK